MHGPTPPHVQLKATNYSRKFASRIKKHIIINTDGEEETGKEVSNLVFYAQSTITVISGRKRQENQEWKGVIVSLTTASVATYF